jgi:hypothetical protein
MDLKEQIIQEYLVTRCFIKLAYFDKLNGDTIKKQALDDL